MGLFDSLTRHREIPSSITTLTYASYANCKNGKIIAVFQADVGDSDYENKIKQGYFADYATFKYQNEQITDVTTALTFTGYRVRAMIFNINDDLFLTVTKRIEPFSTGIYGVYLYKSPSGNGEDWELYSTIQELTSTATDNRGGTLWPTSIPVISSSGRWIIHHNFFYQDGSGLFMGDGISISDDYGLTWTNKFNHWGGTGWFNYGDTFALSPAIFDGILYFLKINGYVNTVSLLKSSDNGDNWTIIDGGHYGTFYAASDGFLYYIYDYIYDCYIYRTSSEPSILPIGATPDSPWELIATIGSIESGGYLCFISINGEPTLISGCYAYKNGLPLQTQKNYIAVEVNPNGTMVYNDVIYKYVETLYSGEVTTHTTAGETSIYDYGGDSITINDVIYQYVASGITDPLAPGGFGTYLPDTSRTVEALTDRENFVNFYYIGLTVPDIVTTSIADETLDGFTVNIEIANKNGSDITACGFVWGTSPSPTLETADYVDFGPGDVGVYSGAYGGNDVQPDTTYYVRAFAVNGSGVGYGEDLTFSVASTLPTVSTDSVTNVSSTGFIVQMSVPSLGDKTVTIGFVWGISANPRLDDGVSNEVLIGYITSPDGTRYSYIGEVEAATTYYLAAYATNKVGTVYGSDVTFTRAKPFNWEFIATPNHSRLNNLDKDDHSQYHTDARGDARYIKIGDFNNHNHDDRYYIEAEVDALLADAGAYYEPLINGDSTTPEFIFYDGDIVMGRVS